MKYIKTVTDEKNNILSKETWYGFGQETIDKLANIGIKPTGNNGQYCDGSMHIFVYDKYDYPCIQHTMFVRNIKDLEKLPSIEKIIKKIYDIIKVEYEEE